VGNRPAEVFNMFVDKLVEKGRSIFVSDSPEDASTLCTAAGAGTFVVGLVAKFLLANVRGWKSRLKVRLDKLLVDRGLAASRERAQALILAGKVLVDDQKLEKAGAQVAAESVIRLLGEDLRYVSRGGLKLERALDYWTIEVTGKVCLDVGASTGGFTDCLLQRGAARVIAIDTGYGQMDFKLRQDARVRLLEKTNARYLTRDAVGESVELIVMDVSFISATLVLPAVIASVFPEPSRERTGRQIVVLIKPQFEAGREHVGKGGIVRDEAAQKVAVERVRESVTKLGAREMDVIESPILGAEGNREFLLYGLF
jgi:23S rRNA (cytidine1920-2'-O)/16S rRNA (cytidine1409-2'-O)-methyltransferase